MEFDIPAIIDRMKIATNSENNFQLSKFMNKSPSIVNNWLNGKAPPWSALWEVREKTGIDFDWLVTGKTKEVVTPDEEQEIIQRFSRFKKSYLRTMMIAYELKYYARTPKTTDANLEDMAEMTFRKYENIDFETPISSEDKDAKKSS